MRASSRPAGDARPIVRGMVGLAALVLLPAAGPLTAGQEAALARTLTCPEHLRDDAARLAQATRFVQAYGRLAPRSRMGEREAARQRLLAARGCRRQADGLQYSFPET